MTAKPHHILLASLLVIFILFGVVLNLPSRNKVEPTVEVEAEDSGFIRSSQIFYSDDRTIAIIFYFSADGLDKVANWIAELRSDGFVLVEKSMVYHGAYRVVAIYEKQTARDIPYSTGGAEAPPLPRSGGLFG